ncbi:MAG: site-specific recombinase XerD [Psychromonas sp.]|jgi:site-specific recombinase XerD
MTELMDSPTGLINSQTEDIFFDKRNMLRDANHSTSYIGPAESYMRTLSDLSQSTVRSYLRNIARIFDKNIEDFPWHQLDQDVVIYILDNLTKTGLAPGTVGSYLSAIKGVCLSALNKKTMSPERHHLINIIKKPKGSRVKKEGTLLSAENIRDLIKTCDQDLNKTKGVRDKAIIIILRGCGLRRTELINIRINRINFTEKKLTVVGKGNKEREIWFSERVKQAILDWLGMITNSSLEIAADNFLFLRAHKSGKVINQRICSQTVFDIFQAKQKLMMVKKFGPHDFRRTYITELINDGNAIEDIQGLVGHSSPETTRVYDLNKKRNLKKIGQDITF